MEVINPRCAGLDVHKKSISACCISRSATGARIFERRTFGTMTTDILMLGEWLHSLDIPIVALESTGVYWKPIWNLLESDFDLMLVNPQHIKQVPGRKTDVKDAEWIATLLEHGLLRASFVPPAPHRAFRELTRTRSTLIRQRSELVNRVQKVLEDANIKLASVATDVMGVSGRAMIEAMVVGETDPKVLASLAVRGLRNKQEELEQALLGRVADHHRIIIKQFLSLIDALDSSIAELEKHIGEASSSFRDVVDRLDAIPGVGPVTAQMILSEIGTDMDAFPSDRHLCAWSGLAPGNNESAGKQLPGRPRKGNRSLRTGLIQAAHAAARSKGTYLSALYRRIAARRGNKKATVAVAHAILKAVYHMIVRQTAYHELGEDYYDKLSPRRTAPRLIRRLREMGYTVTKQPDAANPA